MNMMVAAQRVDCPQIRNMPIWYRILLFRKVCPANDRVVARDARRSKSAL
jgi:hypothetical protein